MFFLFLSLFVSSADILELTPSNTIDLYSIIGVKKKASSKEILKSFKRFLVKKRRLENTYLSNDTRKSNLQPNEKVMKHWKQVEYAFSILGDTNQRELYDTYGFSFINQTGFSVFGYQSEFQALFMRNFFNQEIEPFAGIIMFPLHLALLDAMNGCKKTVKVIQTVPCHCPRGGTRCAKCRNNKYMTQTVQHTVEVPPGTPEGYKMMVKDLGDSSTARGASDVVFIIHFLNDQSSNSTEIDGTFRRVDPYGPDLTLSKKITLAQVIDGNEVEIENLDGEKIMVPISEGEKLTLFGNMEKKISGKGLPLFDEPKKRGDLIVKFFVDFPKSLNDEQKKAIEKLLPVDIDQNQ